MNSKYSNLLTVLLVIVIVAIIGIIAFLGYKYYESNEMKNNSEDFVDTFLNDLNSGSNNNNNNNNNGNTNPDDNIFSGVDEGENNNNSSTPGSAPKFNGFTTAGSIEIPATNVKAPIISKSELSKSALETSIVEMYGVGLNQVGNTTLIGHNYRNGLFFSNNKKLNVGDKIYITDLTGKRLSYTIYNKYEADENEADYMTRDTQGAVEISLSTCTDDSKARLVIWAKADI